MLACSDLKQSSVTLNKIRMCAYSDEFFDRKVVPGDRHFRPKP